MSEKQAWTSSITVCLFLSISIRRMQLVAGLKCGNFLVLLMLRFHPSVSIGRNLRKQCRRLVRRYTSSLPYNDSTDSLILSLLSVKCQLILKAKTGFPPFPKMETFYKECVSNFLSPNWRLTEIDHGDGWWRVKMQSQRSLIKFLKRITRQVGWGWYPPRRCYRHLF